MDAIRVPTARIHAQSIRTKYVTADTSCSGAGTNKKSHRIRQDARKYCESKILVDTVATANS